MGKNDPGLDLHLVNFLCVMGLAGMDTSTL